MKGRNEETLFGEGEEMLTCGSVPFPRPGPQCVGLQYEAV